MAKKTLTLTILSFFAFLLLVSFVSSTITLSSTSPSLLKQQSGSFLINVTSDQDETITINASSISDSNGNLITFTPVSSSFNNETKQISINYLVDNEFNFFGKTYTTTLTALGNVSGTSTKTLTFETLDFCSYESNNPDEISSNNLRLSIDDIRVKSGLGSDEDWFPFDEVEIDLVVTNKNRDYDINDIVLEWGLFDKTKGEWFIEPTEEKEFDLNNKDDTTITISFFLNENDLNVDLEDLYNSDLVFYARATGEVDNDTVYTTCNSVQTKSNEISVHVDRDFVIANDFKVLENAICGSPVQISGKVWNIGQRNQKDLTMTIYNKELGINQNLNIGDIDSFSSKKFSVDLAIPDDVKAKNYSLAFSVYDDNGDLFESNYEDLESTTYLNLNVQGNCASTTPKASISAKLQSDAVSGKDLLVKFVISNLNSKETTFNLELSGYQLWASSAELDKSSLTLSPGESAEVLATLKVNDDVSGAQNFNILVKQADKILSQEVSVEVSSAKEYSGFFEKVLSNLKQGNTYIWIIGALNLILIILIIIISVRLAKK
jgi:hypothetical protein